jgi:VWFA-related protein
MSGKAILLSAGCLLFAGGLLISQQPIATSESGRTPSLTVTVKVVNVPATVRDKHGQLVNSLSKDDFVLEQDGRPQQVRYFAHDTDLPLTLGLLVDTSNSQLRVLDQERRASYTFLDQMLRQSKDSAFVIHFDHEVELLQDITSSREKLEAALQTVQMSSSDGGSGNRGGGGGWNRNGRGPYGGGSYPGGGGGGGHHRHGYGGGGTLLYDAAYLASDELMKKQQGRKALIILSDGVDTGSRLSLETAIEASQRADTIVYSILFVDEEAYGRGGFGGFGGRRGPGFPGDPANGKKVLEQISKQTGGRLFEVSKKQPIEKIYQSIAEELRNQYNLGYTPDKAQMADGYHKINLKTKQKDLVVQAREGYYASR